MVFGIISIRKKLIALFTFIKILPLILIIWLAWYKITELNAILERYSVQVSTESRSVVKYTSQVASEEVTKELNRQAQASIECLTENTAIVIADFLYMRDRDIELAAQLPLTETAFKSFLATRYKYITAHEPWELDESGTVWRQMTSHPSSPPTITSSNPDNSNYFHSKPNHHKGKKEPTPLYTEMTYFDKKGQELIKVSNNDFMSKTPNNISNKENTFCKAESYFKAAQKLKLGEIYVSDVIGAYVRSPVIGAYLPTRLKQKGLPFTPEESAYAGKENPVGKEFQGIIRWVTPVAKNGEITGYISLALNHEHIMEFTDHLVPSEESYTNISDASTGNYAFMLDYKGRTISHPRDYFIVGYNPDTGEVDNTWMDRELYRAWKDSELSLTEFQKTAPIFHQQSLNKKPAHEQVKAGDFAADCRYLNFAPQCEGWFNLTQYGGSGSFFIFWSNLWKLNTAAIIPYFTGDYANTPRGFGIVTLSANVHEFHHAANEINRQLSEIQTKHTQELTHQYQQTANHFNAELETLINNFKLYALLMLIAIIILAIWIATSLTSRIKKIIYGLQRLQEGELSYRLKVSSQDEMGQLGHAVNTMAEKLQYSVDEINTAKQKAEESTHLKSNFLLSVSHELRTPLNGIIGYSELLHSEITDDDQREILSHILSSGQRLNNMVGNILDLTDMESGQFHLSSGTVYFTTLLNQLAQKFSPLANKKGVDFYTEFSPNIPEIIYHDGKRLTQLFEHLLDNAIKFTSEGHINFIVKYDKANQQLLLSVIDTGKGIPKSAQETVFKRFSQASNIRTRKEEGAGLGLAFCRELVRLMQGKIIVESEVNIGTTFIIYLPANLQGV